MAILTRRPGITEDELRRALGVSRRGPARSSGGSSAASSTGPGRLSAKP